MQKLHPYSTNVHDAIVMLRQVLSRDLPESRERACALTKLDECQLWALACMNGVAEDTDLGLGKAR